VLPQLWQTATHLSENRNGLLWPLLIAWWINFGPNTTTIIAGIEVFVVVEPAAKSQPIPTTTNLALAFVHHHYAVAASPVFHSKVIAAKRIAARSSADIWPQPDTR
jgi:hypothetical protein